MFEKRENIYYGVLGTTGLLFLIYLTLFPKEYIQYNLPLFLMLTLGSILLQGTSMKIGEFKITLDTSIYLGAYFILGLSPTLWVILISLIISDNFISTIPKRKIYSNIGMFVLTYIISHFIFKVTGNNFSESPNLYFIVKAILFGFLVFIVNWLFLFLQFFVTSDEKLPEGWQESFLWDFYGNIVVIPLSILLTIAYYKYKYYGIMFLLLLITFICLLFKIIRNLIYMNKELRVVQEVAVSISSRLELSETTSSILKGISDLINCDFSIIFEINKESLQVKALDFRNDKNNLNIDIDTLTKSIKGLFDNCKTSLVIEDVKRSKIKKSIELISRDIGSLIYEPLILNNEMIGYLLAFSKTRGKFSKEHLYILDILANQAVIAIENARLYKDIHNKATIDGLTGLYNQRYFYDLLDSITENCKHCINEKCIRCNTISLVIFDIDYFKLTSCATLDFLA